MFSKLQVKFGIGRVSVVMVFVVAVGGAVFALAAPGGATDGPIDIADVRDGAVLDVGTMTVNLADENPRYARIGVAIVLAEGVEPLVVEAKLPLVRDAVLTVMGAQTAADVTGSDALDDLREALSNRARVIFNVEQTIVLRVVLTDLLVQ